MNCREENEQRRDARDLSQSAVSFAWQEASTPCDSLKSVPMTTALQWHTAATVVVQAGNIIL